MAKTLAVYDRSDPGAARVIIVAGSDFEGTSPKLFWPENISVFAAWCGIKSDADPGVSDQIGDALRAGATAICRIERSLACGRTTGAPERGRQSLRRSGRRSRRCSLH